MSTDQLSFQIETLGQISTEDPLKVGVSHAEAFAVMSRFDEIGIWRAELDTGLVFWTESVFRIYGLEPNKGPVNIADAINSYHPEDREVVLNCVEEAARLKTGYRFVLRLQRPDGEIVWVKSHAIFRENEDAGYELYGYIERFSPCTRSVTILKEHPGQLE